MSSKFTSGQAKLLKGAGITFVLISLVWAAINFSLIGETMLYVANGSLLLAGGALYFVVDSVERLLLRIARQASLFACYPLSSAYLPTYCDQLRERKLEERAVPRASLSRSGQNLG